MVDTAVSFAIGKLGDFVMQQVNIRIGVKDGVRWLRDELSYLQASVRAAESRQEDEQIRNWVNEVKNVANDAVTILQRFSMQQEHQARLEQGILHRLWTCIWTCIGMCTKEDQLLDIGMDIESLKRRIVLIKGRRSEYGIDNILATPNVKQKQRTLLRTTAIDSQVDVVGFKDDIKTLMAELDSMNPSLKVISIHGMGGLGKTSLATKLYNSSELRHFDTRAKVCVSNEYDITDVLKRIIKSFMGPEHEQYMSNMGEHDLLQYLPKLLQDRGCYFAVIDDIWDIEAWEQIKNAFPKQKNGSRIIITTRKKKVAETVDDKCFVHHLRFLTDDESWQLFCKRAEPTNQNMEELGKEIAAKCGGLPLAIVVLSGLLLHNKSYGYWLKVKKHVWRHVEQGGSSQIEEILSLSYNDLSLQMKDCFLYLARYPEDHVIESIELKLLWMAEEFISEGDEGEGVVMEDLAEDYLNELINRNLIQIDHLEWNREVLYCRVHDLVRDLAIKKAKELKSLVIIDSSKHHHHHHKQKHMLEGQSRHVIYNEIGEYLKLAGRRFDTLNVRALALVNYPSDKMELKEMKLMCTRFKNLEVLDMTSVMTDEIPEEIGDLFLLKYLGLAGGVTDDRKPIIIPASIAKLKKLQTLRGPTPTSRQYIFPREICELPELRCIDFLSSGSLNIGNHQTKLHTLKYIEYKQWAKIDTIKFTNLHRLDIRDTEKEGNDGYTLESIANLTSLETFCLYSYYTGIPTMKPLSSLSCSRLKSVDLVGAIRDPSELSYLPHSLTSLSLAGSEFTEDPMPTLGNLFNLTALQLQMVYVGNKMVISRNAFPSLQILRLNFFGRLEELQVEDGALPSLQTFETHSYLNLNKIPVQLKRCFSKK